MHSIIQIQFFGAKAKQDQFSKMDMTEIDKMIDDLANSLGKLFLFFYF